MTTNKPEAKRYKIESGHDSVMRKVDRMQESEDGPYVRFDDYEALQAECEKQRNDLMDALRAARGFIRNQRPQTTKLPDGRVRLEEDVRTAMRILWKIDAALTGIEGEIVEMVTIKPKEEKSDQ